MSDEESIDAASGALGYAIANYAFSLNTLTLLVRKQIITREEAFDAISRARRLVEKSGGFPGDPDSLKSAKQCITLIEEAFLAETAQMPPSGAH